MENHGSGESIRHPVDEPTALGAVAGRGRWRRLSNAQATLLAALVVVLPSVATGFATYIAKPDPAETLLESLRQQLGSRPGWTAHAYPHLGIAFLAPSSWIADDAAARVAGGDADIIKRYESDSGAAIGVQFQVQSIQANYIEDLDAQVANQLDVDLTLDPSSGVRDVVVGGHTGKVFSFTLSTGQRRGDVRRYWVRLIPEVQLEILAFIYTDSPDREAFWEDVDAIVSSLVVDRADYEARRKRLLSRS